MAASDLRPHLCVGGVVLLVVGNGLLISAAWGAPSRETAGVVVAVAAAGTVSFTEDPAMREVVRQALEARPELKQGRALIEADRARVPQSRILPDPVLTLGIQNDGLARIQIGKMETSWATVMAAQSFPWFGKRDLRAGVVETQVGKAESDLDALQHNLRVIRSRAGPGVRVMLVVDDRGQDLRSGLGIMMSRTTPWRSW